MPDQNHAELEKAKDGAQTVAGARVLYRLPAFRCSFGRPGVAGMGIERSLEIWYALSRAESSVMLCAFAICPQVLPRITLS